MKLKDLVKGTKVTDNKIAHKEVPIDKLDAMLNYQRDIDMKRVEKLSSDEYFDENEVDEVKVSVREDGSMKVWSAYYCNFKDERMDDCTV